MCGINNIMPLSLLHERNDALSFYSWQLSTIFIEGPKDVCILQRAVVAFLALRQRGFKVKMNSRAKIDRNGANYRHGD